MTPTLAMRMAKEALDNGDMERARAMLAEALSEEEAQDAEPRDERARLLVPISEARRRLPELIARVIDCERVVLLRRGTPVATIIAMVDADNLEGWEDEVDRRDFEEARAEGGPTVSWEEVKRHAGLE
jgi:prevent-host-death family protein